VPGNWRGPGPVSEEVAGINLREIVEHRSSGLESSEIAQVLELDSSSEMKTPNEMTPRWSGYH
jgi:hypothetical protein